MLAEEKVIKGVKIWYEEEFKEIEAKLEKTENEKNQITKKLEKTENEKNQITKKLEKTENENKKLRNILKTNGIII